MAAPITLTYAERELLRALAHDIGPVIASPDHGIWHLRDGQGSGGGHGFEWKHGGKGLEGWWFEWWPDRIPRTGKLLREVTISYARLRRWATQLPADVRAQARTWWATHPENTRDLEALHRLTLEQLAEPPGLFDL